MINDNNGDSFFNSKFPQGLMKYGSQKHELKYQLMFISIPTNAPEVV